MIRLHFQLHACTVRPLGTVVDPGFDRADLLRGEGIALARHPHLGIAALDGMYECRLCAVSDFDGEAEVATFQRARFVIQPQRSLLFVRAMAGVAAFPENGLHIAHKIHRAPNGHSQTETEDKQSHWKQYAPGDAVSRQAAWKIQPFASQTAVVEGRLITLPMA